MMIPFTTEQIEELRHRKGNEIFCLNKINAEIVYFLDKTSNLVEPFKGVENYRELIFRCLGSNDHSKRMLHGKKLMKELWEAEIGIGPYPFSEILSLFEFGGKFWDGYRDHVLHQIKVYLLGLYLFFGCKKIRLLFKNNTANDFLKQWKIASLSHDHGYLFEAKGAETNQWVIDKVMPVFDLKMGFPISSLSESIRNTKKNQHKTTLKSEIYSSLKKRGITKAREDQIQNHLNIVRPQVRTIGDLCSFKSSNLFDLIDDIGRTTNLSIKKKRTLESYYDFASKYSPSEKIDSFRDHGITSALFLLLQLKYHEYFYTALFNTKTDIWNKIGLPKENLHVLTNILGVFNLYKNHIIEASKAVAVHNITANIWNQNDKLLEIAEKDFGLTLQDYRVVPESNPLAFLLILADTLQDWDRPCFTGLSTSDLPKFQADQDLSINLDNENIHISFPNEKNLSFDPYDTLLKELSGKIDSNFVKSFLQKSAWKGLGICKLTKEAEEIESSCRVSSNFVTSTKLKQLISISQKSEIFEYTLFLNTKNQSDFLKLLKHIVAFANTNGGYFVVGIDENGCVAKGIDDRTYIHGSENLNDLINLYCSRQIEYFKGKKKILITKNGKKTYKTFFVFYVPKNENRVYFIRDGKVFDSNKLLFKKFDVPKRSETKTELPNGKKNDSLASCSDSPKIPGELPKPDFDKLIARENEKLELLDFLNNRKVFAWTVDGVGGSGKSALSLDVATKIQQHEALLLENDYNLDFEGIVWVSAKSCELNPQLGIVPKFDTTVTLEILLDKIADVLDLPELKYIDIEEKTSTVLEFLEETRLLIIIDNLESIPETHQIEIIKFIESKLPPPSKVIYTTRTKFHRGYSTKIMELSHDEAVLLSKNIALKNENFELVHNKNLINSVVERTGGIPLGIKWLISRICAGYKFSVSFDELLEDKTLVQFCFEDTLKYLEDNDEVALYSIALCDFSPHLKDIEIISGLSSEKLKNCVELLESFSLIKVYEGDITLLPLTKDYALYQLNKNEVLAAKLQKNMEKIYRGSDYKISNEIPANEIVSMNLYKKAAFDESQGDLKTACEKLEKALSLSEKDYIMKSLAGIYERLTRVDDAIELFNKYLEKFGDDYTILKKIAQYCVKNHDHLGALGYVTRALAIKSDDKDLWHHKGRRELTLAFENGKDTQRGLKFCNSAILSFKNGIREPEKSKLDMHYNAITYYNMARAYFWKFETNKAYDACIMGLEKDQHNTKLNSFIQKVKEYL